MKCPRCAHENSQGARFCEECATPLAATCANCGTTLSGTAKFCHACAHPAAVGAARPSRSPDSYTPKHLAERIINSKAALEGERKQITVLFADLKASMELLAERDPEDARRLLDPVLERMMEAVHRYEGTVNQVMGDGIMALFGAPLAHEDHAVHACCAALHMQDSVRRYADEVRRRDGVSIQIRVGLNSGEVVVRSIGSDLRMDYSAVGQTTHLASRMEQLASPGSTLLTADTLRLTGAAVMVKSVGPVHVNGLANPIDVYELEGARWARRRLQARVALGLSRFVGRQTELDTLRQALEKVDAGQGQIVGVLGEPGVGKSRLFYEFTRSLRGRERLILESGAVSYGKARPFLPIIDLLTTYFQIEVGDDLRRVREKVTGRVLTLDEALKPTLPALLALLDASVDDPQWAALDPQQRRRRTLDAVKHLLLRESQIQPVVVVLEDLQWVDSETHALFGSLAEWLPTARILVLVNYRAEYQHPWGPNTSYTLLPMDPLPRAGASDLLAALLGNDVALEPLKRFLIDRTEGNPLFIEESVRTLVETDALVGERGAYRLGKAVLAAPLAPTIQAVLAARIDRLPFEGKRLLQCAAVIGTDIPFQLLHAVADLPDDALRRGLANLRMADFLYETGIFPDLEYSFKHELTHETAYASLLHERRRAIHGAIADAIERLYADRLSEYAERLAHHSFRGERWAKAVTHYRQASDRAMFQSAYREAVGCLEHALTALGRLPETRETLERSIDVRMDLRAALFPLGEFAKLLHHLREAERLCRTLDDPRRLAWVSAFMIIALWIIGDADEALAFGRAAEDLPIVAGDSPLQAVVATHVGAVWTTLGDYHRAEEHLRKVQRVLTGAASEKRLGRAGFPAVLSRLYLTMGLTDRGAFAEAIATAREALDMAERLDHSWARMLAQWSLAYVLGIRGDLAHATRLLERSLMLARDGNVAFFSAIVAWFLGRTYALSGRIAEGLGLLRAGLAEMETMGLRPYQAVTLVHEGEVLVLDDRLDEARTSGDRALRLAQEQDQRAYQALAHRLLGDIAARREFADVVMAEHQYGAAAHLAAELGMRPLTAQCALGLGRLYRRVGDRQRAQQQLAAATALFRELEMPLFLATAHTEMAALS